MAGKKTKPYYELSEIKGLIRKKSIIIRQNALISAWNDFGWDTIDILYALNKLNKAGFLKSEQSHWLDSIMLDFYEIRNLKEKIFIHISI